MAPPEKRKNDGSMTWTTELKTLLKDDVRQRLEAERAAKGKAAPNTTRVQGQRTVITLVGPRACGKTTVGKALMARLPTWRFIDLDEVYEQRYKRSVASELMLDTDNYYDDLRKLLVEFVASENLIIAVSGGSLVNSKYPFGCLDSLQACQQHANVVLLLPSRFDFRNMSILYQRESERDYAKALTDKNKLRTICRKNYKERVPFYKGHANLVVYGSDPHQNAARITAAFNLG